ncbi:MAG TPA: prolyl oligopeptidase family serine peptidase [Steroidobacteraceae bacterium]|nr:prolyl oligopeptidase family serine peptidase [Steroidobacteraceae bacterium]
MRKHHASRILGPLLLALAALLASPSGGAREARGRFTLRQVLGYPFPRFLTSLPSGRAFAWVSEVRGVRNVWLAEAPEYRARKVTHYTHDSGQELTYLEFSRDGRYLVYVRGGDHDANWPEPLQPDPTASPVQPHMQVWSVAVRGGAPRLLGRGDAPALSPDGREVAFIRRPDQSVWIAPIDGGARAKRLFFDIGKDSSLHWSPDGRLLAFVSHRGDHSFIGIFRNDSTPLEFLTPSTSHDSHPRWSPHGRRIAFIRTPGRGGPPQNPLRWHRVPWSIHVADVARDTGRRIWKSPDTLAGSFTHWGAPVVLHWAAGDRLVFVDSMDNWPHLYAVSAAGGAARLLTPGAFRVDYVRMTPDRRWLVYTANTGATPGDNDRRHLYRVAVDGGPPRAITRGTHSAWSPALTDDARIISFIDAGPRRPPEVLWGPLTGTRWRSAGGDPLPADFPTRELVVPRPVEFHAADGWAVQGQLFQAAGGAAHKAGIIFVHGGPPRQMMLTWHDMGYYSNSYAVNQYLADHGFIVLSVNYRLSIGYGHAFQYPAGWGPTGAAEYKDVLAGAKWLQRDPRVDPKRIGIWGGSYGGYLTALGLARNSDIFKAGVDMHGVHDWSMFGGDWFDKPIERYQMPDMKKVLRTAWLSSPDSAIGTWKSPVLLIQGDDDRNVHFHQMVDLVRRLQLAHVPYQELVIPDEIHVFLRYHTWLEADRATVRFFKAQLLPSRAGR